MKNKSMIISWGNYIRRSSSISELTGLNELQFQSRFKKIILKPIDYFLAFIRSLYSVVKFRNKTELIVLVLPPNFLLYLVPFISITARKNTKIYADCHNSTFAKKWRKMPFFEFFLQKCDLIIVHNEDFRTKIYNTYSFKNLQVIPDPPSIPNQMNLNDLKRLKDDYFVLPASFASDEPIDELIYYLKSNRFQELGSRIYITGPSHKLDKSIIKVIDQINNVSLTGFLSNNEYEILLKHSTGVLCLTKHESIQLCAINEAIGFGSVPIFSATNTLTKMYENVGVRVDVTLNDIHEKLLECLAKKDYLLEKSLDFKLSQVHEWSVNYGKYFIN